MRSTTVRSSHVILFFMGFILFLCLGTISLENYASQMLKSDEFAINYSSAKNWVSQARNPYDALNGVRINNQLIDDTEGMKNSGVTYFRYPLLTALVIMPFTLLPLASAKAAWMVFSILCLVTGSLLMITVGGRKVDSYVLAGLTLFTALNYFSIIALSTGNLLPQLFLIIMLVLTLIKDRHDAMAGFFSTGILLLPQFGILTVIFLNVWAIKGKRRQFLTSFWAGLIFLLGISTIIEPAWLRGWLSSIIQDIYSDGSYTSLLSQVLRNEHANTLWINLIPHLSLLLLVFASSSAFNYQTAEGLAWMLSLLLTVNSMIAFPALPGIQLLCVSAIIMVIGTWMARQGAFSKTFFWIILAVLFVIPWVTGIFSNHVIHIIFYATFALLGLYWIRWWMIRPKYY
jgi:hypothetical protein